MCNKVAFVKRLLLYMCKIPWVKITTLLFICVANTIGRNSCIYLVTMIVNIYNRCGMSMY